MLDFHELAFGFFTDNFLVLLHNRGVGVGTGCRTEHIVCVLEATGPVTQSCVACFLERGGPFGDGINLGAHQFHAKHVGLLTCDIFSAHIDAAFKAHQSADNGGGYAVLACACFRNDARFAHPFCQKCLTEHLIRFVCAAVHEVFSLEIELGFGALGEIAAQRNRRGATGVGGQ